MIGYLIFYLGLDPLMKNTSSARSMSSGMIMAMG
jgi:hypothetical protein